MKKSKATLTLVLILVLGNIIFGAKYFLISGELREAKAALEIQKTNEKILDFSKFFIKEVLRAENEVDFDTRLKLENSVRGLEDEEIFNQWQKFTESDTEREAQAEVTNLLGLLLEKIRVDLKSQI
ncbi:MAG: hypothetical protein A3D44_04450 [Candidatus Staskawiczbacteria bacterium RIFCSPHIGHO2_02_FULL_42_22]|uniref:Uncharacterized protein n=1 Tax=Candidatus Staskawiczbacteria bacterium RIFCSPHIGHO2_02_FULL_42_22 TaxID=1802207 RepID=A0A1G2I0P3_9BACT|nr:MAG: hypothetical protein A3D44_04450 [Candidatus Staskawiczbacteria bacterium RIFCSPHIGHO2_02_FULL_42_22]